MNQLIIAPPIGETPSIAITEEGQHRKDQLLALSTDMGYVTTIEGRDTAVSIAGKIKAHLSDVEKNRVEVKEPFLSMCRAIDKAKADHFKELEPELARLNGLIGSFEKARREAEEAAERVRRAEEARIAQEAEKARLESLRLAEEVRKKEEAAAAKGKELTDSQKAKNLEAQLDAQASQELAEANRKRIDDERAAASARSFRALPTGGSLRQEIELTITDLHALYAACRDAVKLVPDLNFIKGMYKHGTKYPGVSYGEKSSFATRRA